MCDKAFKKDSPPPQNEKFYIFPPTGVAVYPAK